VLDPDHDFDPNPNPLSYCQVSTVRHTRDRAQAESTLSELQEPTSNRLAALTAENDALRTRAEHLQGRCLDDLAPVDLCDLINTLTGVSRLLAFTSVDAGSNERLPNPFAPQKT